MPFHSTLRVLLVIFALLAFSGTLCEADRKPNILLLLADDLGYSDLGCYGSEIATPNLDALAQSGLRFTQFYNTARCWPSRAAILTGYYAQAVRRDSVPGVPSGIQGVRPSWAPLLPALLRPLGYRTYHSGKWHLDSVPLQTGFDRSYSLNDHDRHFAPHAHTEDDRPLPPVTPGSGYYSTTAIADHAIRCLKDHAQTYTARPFFSFVAFTSPHFPVQAPPEDIAWYRDVYTRGWDVMRQERWTRMQGLGIGGSSLSSIERQLGPPYAFPTALKQLGPNEINLPLPWDTLTPDQRTFQASKMAFHAAMVDRMDREIGRILAQVKAMGAQEDTLVIFLSDNGASAEMMVRGDRHDPHAESGSAATFLSIGPGWSSVANTPFRLHKTWMHEGGISTSFIVSYPAKIRAHGDLRTTPAHIVDVVPTILELATGHRNGGPVSPGAPPPPGKSLVPAFTHNASSLHETLWWLHEGNRALRAGDWKIVAAGADSPWELYDMRLDRSESKDLAARMPERVRKLSARWTRIQQEQFALARQSLPKTPKPAAAVQRTAHR